MAGAAASVASGGWWPTERAVMTHGPAGGIRRYAAGAVTHPRVAGTPLARGDDSDRDTEEGSPGGGHIRRGGDRGRAGRRARGRPAGRRRPAGGHRGARTGRRRV